MGTRRLNLSGQEFGQLVVLDFQGSNKWGQSLWSCFCNNCWQTKVICSTSLVSHKAKSCGCRIGKGRITHGKSKTAEFTAWRNMIKRCENPKQKCWPNYGGRGIKVCDSWRKSFTAFLSDMGQKPSPKHSLDRINVNGNYEPGNCRWATSWQQRQNTRRWSEWQEAQQLSVFDV